ncbi:MAG TPA: hypothetical protein VJ767_11635 [Nitrososphaeraceae archaeon]|nr:hypothetical protein [Nitrososphaeraceae archaeon]
MVIILGKLLTLKKLLKEFKICNEKVVLTFELKPTLLVNETKIKNVLMFQENRGSYYRPDFPKLSDEKRKIY